MPEIEVRQLSKIFRGGRGHAVVAVDGINFEVESGEFLALVGPSGCGKTTILHMIDGLVRPSSGSISVGGRVVNGPNHDIGLVLQEHALLPWRTARANVELGLEIRGWNGRKKSDRAMQLLEMVGLKGFEERRPHELSGGMRQRVALCRALAFDPRILLMDEPFANLDAQTRILLEEELVRIWEKTGKTIIFVTHDITEAIALSTRLMVMTARPGTIKRDVRVDVPKGDDLVAIRSSPEFGKLQDDVWRELREEVLKSMKLV